jgi:hypothetical protein
MEFFYFKVFKLISHEDSSEYDGWLLTGPPGFESRQGQDFSLIYDA